MLDEEIVIIRTKGASCMIAGEVFTESHGRDILLKYVQTSIKRSFIRGQDGSFFFPLSLHRLPFTLCFASRRLFSLKSQARKKMSLLRRLSPLTRKCTGSIRCLASYESPTETFLPKEKVGNYGNGSPPPLSHSRPHSTHYLT